MPWRRPPWRRSVSRSFGAGRAPVAARPLAIGEHRVGEALAMALQRLGNPADVAEVRSDPMIMAARAVHRGPHVAHRPVDPTKIASAISEWPMLSSRILRRAATGPTLPRVSRGRHGISRPRPAPCSAARRIRPSFVRDPGRIAVEGGLAIAARVQLDHRRPEGRAASITAGSGSTNSETGSPPRLATGCAGRGDRARRRCRGALGSSSSRFSGTRQAACGRVSSAIATISSVAAISKLRGTVRPRLSAAMSVSRIWRRSSRRCAVMPSAPASTASKCRAHRVGIIAATGVRRWRRGRC